MIEKYLTMNAHTASAINAFSLIALGGWGYFDGRSVTALIPVFFGVILLVLNQGIKNENKVVAHIAVLLTLLIFVALIKPFMGAMDDGRTTAMIRVGLMILTSLFAMVFFIKSFRDARKARVNQ